MKSLIKKLSISLILILGLISCEDVIDVDTPTEDPRLIIDALIRVDTTAQFTDIVVKVSQTSNFFESIVPANLQQITITNLDNGEGEVLIENPPGSGIYSNPEPFLTENLMNGELILQIDFEDEFYVALANFVPSVPIDSVINGDGFLFDEDDKEIIITFTDDGDRDDFYLFDFGFGNYLVTEDEFYQGQQFEFSYFYDDEVDVGDEVTISIMGVDQQFYNYMDQIIEQSEEDLGPFQVPTVTVRGNFINATDIDNIDEFDNVGNPDNFALGYFAIVQEYKASVIIEE